MQTLTIDIQSSLESQLERMALESNFVANLADSFRNVIPGLAAKLLDTSEHFKASLFEKPRVKELRLAYDSAKAVTVHADFINYSSLLVSVPEGFKGDFYAYLKLLTKLSPVIYKEANAFIAEYNYVLSDFLTNKEAKKCNVSHDAVYRKVTESREANLKEIEHYFDPKSDSSKTRLKDVVGRFSDLKDLSDQAIELEKTQSISNLQELSDAISKSIYLLNLIKQNLEDDKINEVCGVSASSISNGAYEVAKYVEFVSIFRFKCDQASAAVENTLTTVKQAIHG